MRYHFNIAVMNAPPVSGGRISTNTNRVKTVPK